MRNPVQEYNIARSMPIQALAAVLRGASDMVSLGVAHAALKEKMEAEVAKKGASAMQMAQAPKVLDKDLAMAQGLGATPADVDVPMGGIVGGRGYVWYRRCRWWQRGGVSRGWAFDVWTLP
jgi:hypothetical protein